MSCELTIAKIRSKKINKGSYISAYVLLNLLNELGKEIKCEACRAFYLFFATSLMNLIIKSTNVRFFLVFLCKMFPFVFYLQHYLFAFLQKGI